MDVLRMEVTGQGDATVVAEELSSAQVPTPEVPKMSASEAAQLVDGLMRFHKGLANLHEILKLAVEIEAELPHRQMLLDDCGQRLAQMKQELRAVRVELDDVTVRRDQMRSEVERMKAHLATL